MDETKKNKISEYELRQMLADFGNILIRDFVNERSDEVQTFINEVCKENTIY
jgi:hypothetical protein